MASVIDDDVYVNGSLTARTNTPSAGTITNTHVSASAGIAATKVQQQHTQMHTQVHGSAASTERRAIHTVKGATGSVVSFRAGVVVACVGAATIEVDLLKNGSSILTAAISIDSGDAAFDILSGSLSSTALVADDVLEVSITATAGGGTLGQGLFCELVTREDAQ